MKLKFITMISFILVLLTFGSPMKRINRDVPDETTNDGKVIYAGVRSSTYGIDPFPEPSGWESAMKTMSGYWDGSTPCAIWIVGEFQGPKECHLFFPSDGKNYANVLFNDTDKHEKYLSYFDKAGIKIFLQVEPANADVNTLIELVLKRYKHHECVIGFGIDVEWYRASENPEWGVKVGDEFAKTWEARVKSHHNNYRLFLKHWDRNWISSVVKDIYGQTNSKIIPSIQVKEAYLNDTLSTIEFRASLEEALKEPSVGVVFWSWEALEKDPEKKDEIKALMQAMNQ